MKRAALLALLGAGCLEVGSPVYDKTDIAAPSLLFEFTTPRIFGPDAGVPVVQAGQTIQLVFSETMDDLSLRPGIVIRTNPERNEIPLLIQAPPAGTSPYTVRVSSGEGTYVSGVYTMQLRTLLIDAAGNPFAEELTGFFRVP